MTEAEFAAELRAFARRLRQHCIFHSGEDPVADIAHAMSRRAAELTPSRARRRTTMSTIQVGRRTVTVQKPRAAFGL